MSNPFSDPGVNNPYASSASYAPMPPSGPPKVIFAFKIFCGVMSLGAFAAAGFSVLTLIIFANPAFLPAAQRNEATAVRVVYSIILILSLAMAAAYLFFPLFKPKPGTWVFGMVLLVLAMLSMCGAIPAIILMIFWASEQTRRFYGVSA